MKLMVLAVVALAAAALAAPADQEPIKILKSDFEQQPNGGYAYRSCTCTDINQCRKMLFTKKADNCSIYRHPKTPCATIFCEQSISFETQNGIHQTETGESKTVNDEENKPHEVVVARGSYSYTDNEGKLHTVNYVADENGFQPESDDVPKAPVQA